MDNKSIDSDNNDSNDNNENHSDKEDSLNMGLNNPIFKIMENQSKKENPIFKIMTNQMENNNIMNQMENKII